MGEEGQPIIRDIVAHVDVVVENFSPGLLDRRGLGWDELSALKPDLVMASVSGYGQTGPWSSRPTFDLVAQAATGLKHMTGEPATNPARVPHSEVLSSLLDMGENQIADLTDRGVLAAKPR